MSIVYMCIVDFLSL